MLKILNKYFSNSIKTTVINWNNLKIKNKIWTQTQTIIIKNIWIILFNKKL